MNQSTLIVVGTIAISAVLSAILIAGYVFG